MSLATEIAGGFGVLVAGAGPAGSLAARGIARLGVPVLLVDRAGFPREKVCGSCLSGRALAALADAGLGGLPGALGAGPLRAIRIGVRGGFAWLRLPAGASLSRAALDAALVSAARDAGAIVIEGTVATLLESGPDEVRVRLRRDGEEAVAGVAAAVAADGLAGSFLGSRPEFPVRIDSRSRLGAGVVLPDGPREYGAGVVHMAVGAGGYVGLVRLEDDRLDVAAAFDRDAMRRAGGPGPAAEQVLADAGFPVVPGLGEATWRGTPALTRRRDPVAAGRIFLVGDAASYVEPFTGEGIGWAMAGGLALAPVVAAAARRPDPALARAWAARYETLVRSRQRTCDAVRTLLRRPVGTLVAVRLLARLPALARPVLAGLGPARRPA